MNESKTWICRRRIAGEECGHLVVADFRPEPIRWTDGHVCRFEVESTEAEEPARAALSPNREGENVMSKRKSRTVTHEEPAAVVAPEAPEEAAPERDTRPKGRPGRKAKAQAPEATPAPPKGRKSAKTPAEPKETQADLVVFAFRLKPEERDLIHRAAGAAKASRYVRALCISASRGDEKTVVEIVQAVKQHLASLPS